MIVATKKTLIALGAFLLFSSQSFAANNSEVGIVLLHAKGATTSGPIGSLARKMKKEGFKVELPELPWSRSRIYDKTYEDSMEEITAAVEKLRSSGATKIIVGGQSLGANAALYYGTLNSIDGIMAISPGHVPEFDGFQNRLKGSTQRAKQMIEAGDGDKKKGFTDINQRSSQTVRTTAKIYFSFFDPDGSAVMSYNAANLQAGNPLLWIIGTKDKRAMRKGMEYAFDGARANPMNKYIEIEGATHKNTPVRGAKEIIEWAQSIAAK